MAPSAEQLAEIDRELASFEKSDADLEAVVSRARALATALAGDDALSELLEGLDEAMAQAHAAAKASLPPRPAPRRKTAKTATAVGTPAPRPAADDDEPLGSGLVEIPEEEIRRAELPPVLELPSEPKQLDDAFGEAAVSDIEGLSVDDLFGEESTAASAEGLADGGSSDLSALFAADEPIRLSDPDLDLESLESEPPPPPPRGRTMPPPLPPGARASVKPPAVARSAFPAEDEPDETLTGDRSELSDDSFELLVDDDVLELDDLAGDGTEPPPKSDGDGDGDERKGGLISRILGRK